jgi:carbamoyl-phosphate synthase large subunit
MAGTWTASEPSPTEPFDAAEASFGAPLRLFVRQPLTRSDPGDRDLVQSVVDIACNPIIAGGPVCLLPNGAAQHAGTFRDSFTAATGLPFTVSAFRAWRLSLIDASDAMLVIRTELSESGAYEIAYNVHAGPRVPIFFAVHRSCPIRTTLLQELDELVEAQYQLFTHPSELIEALHRFLTSCDAGTAPLALGKARH